MVRLWIFHILNSVQRSLLMQSTNTQEYAHGYVCVNTLVNCFPHSTKMSYFPLSTIGINELKLYTLGLKCSRHWTQWLKWHLGCPHPISRCLGFQSRLHFQIQLPDSLAGSTNSSPSWIPANPCGRLRVSGSKSSRLLASAQPSPNYRGYLGRKPDVRYPSLPFK